MFSGSLTAEIRTSDEASACGELARVNILYELSDNYMLLY
ncbi:hypothetical protein BN135_3731 [Cronobacter muytjensii 530]